MKIKIADATVKQLRIVAEQVTGAPVPPTSTREMLMARLAAAEFTAEDFEIPADAASDLTRDPAPAAPAAPTATPQTSRTQAERIAAQNRERMAKHGLDPIVTVLVQKGDGDSGEEPVPVGVNGTYMLVPRGVPAPIPYRYYLALDIAKQDTVTEVDGVIKHNVRHSYPHTVLQMPPQSEIDAWNAQQADDARWAEQEATERREKQAQRAA